MIARQANLLSLLLVIPFFSGIVSCGDSSGAETSNGSGGATTNSGGAGAGGGAAIGSGLGTGGGVTTGGGSGTVIPGTGGDTAGGTVPGTGGSDQPPPMAGGTPGVGGSSPATGGAPPVGSGGGVATGGSPSTGGITGIGGADPLPTTGGQPAVDTNPAAAVLIGSVSFSVPSQTFLGQLSVGMTTSNASAEIRYTTNGVIPTAEDALYAGTPLELTATTQLRAQAFVNGMAAGQPSTAIYILRTFDYTADIPIVVMEGYAGGKPQDKEQWLNLAFMTFEPTNGLAELASLPTLATRAGYHLRGQSSQTFPKTPYRVELWNNSDEDEDLPVLGMPDESDWAMIGPCSDSSLIRNAFLYDLAADMGLATMRLRFAEVFINQDDSPLEETDYQGVYAVTETIKNQKDRLNLKQLGPEDTTLPDITGGYIFKFDQLAIDPGETELTCTPVEPPPEAGGAAGAPGAGGAPGVGGASGVDETAGSSATGGRFGWPGFGAAGMPGFVGLGGTMVDGCWDDLGLEDPDPANAEQIAWITAHLQTLHDLMHTDPIGDYRSMIGVASFVDNFIVNELSRNVDAYLKSHYMYKDRDGLITAGPVWDYDFALGNVGNDLEGWQWEEGRAGNTDWHTIMAADPVIMAALAARWQELRPGILSDAQIIARIDAISAPLLNAGPRDIARWPVGECYTWPFPLTTDPPFVGDGTWEGEVQVLKDWVLARLAWMDTQLL